jgi:hypothetical protein
MADDITDRLSRAAEGKFDSISLSLFSDAAAEIERLRAANRDLRRIVDRLGDELRGPQGTA